MKHTKAPWEIQDNGNGDMFIYSVPEELAVVEDISGLTPAEQYANLNLIAAAPDLLEVCKLARKYVAKMVADDIKTVVPPSIALKRIKQAIEKAGG